MTTITTDVQVIIEGRPFRLADHDFTGAELRNIAGIPEKDKLVREEPDGSETAIPLAKSVRPHDGDNFFVSVRFRRG
jgi:hypothetical protein